MLQLSQRPLTSSKLDGELFVPRPEPMAAILRSLALGSNVLLVGRRGSGKTSLLRRLHANLEADSDRAKVAYVDAAPWRELREIVLAIRAALGSDIRDRQRRVFADDVEARTGHPSVVSSDWQVTERDIHEMMTDTVADGGIILVDGIAPDMAFELFGLFRDVLWETRARWVVTADVDHLSEYLRPPADAFFDAVVDIPAMSRSQVVELLQRRAAAAPDTEDARQVLELADLLGDAESTPREALTLARRTLELARPIPDAIAELVEWQEFTAGLKGTAGAVVAALEEYGPLHAGDERLLERVGTTRERVVQVLKNLEVVGVVRAWDEGRRRIYSSASPLFDR
jgi:energy-coupling factor transporter ATP-binding protein EcfA2